MTIIKLITQGQQLINASKVVVASGDVNSVELQVEFDSVAWGEYPVRSATFYTSKDATVHEMMLLNDKCIVPFEVLTEASVLFIGVRGVSADGERVKTSSLVKYKISEGAPAGDKTLTPTMDLYRQYLVALKAEADPVIAAFKEAVQAEANAAIARVSTEVNRTVLWENPDPENSDGFAATTIEMDLSAFQSFRVIFQHFKETDDGEGFGEQTISVKDKKFVLVSHVGNEGNHRRGITISDTGISIDAVDDGADAYSIPVQIIGYKY